MRLDELRPLAQLAGVFLTIPAISTNSVAYKWLDAIEPRLGNTVTEASFVSPRELDVQRTAPVGLNGLELLTLAHWVDGTNFRTWTWVRVPASDSLQPSRQSHKATSLAVSC